MKKRILTLLAAVILIAAFTVPVFAATVNLPTAPVITNNDNQKGWCVNGTDGVTTDLTIEQLKAATTLTLEITAKPTGGFQFVIQSDNGWAWSQTELTAADVYSNGKLTFKLADMQGYTELQSATAQAKFYVCYYDTTVDELGITKAYLTTGGSGNGGNGNNAKTADSPLIYIAGGALVAAACSVVLITSKKART